MLECNNWFVHLIIVMIHIFMSFIFESSKSNDFYILES